MDTPASSAKQTSAAGAVNPAKLGLWPLRVTWLIMPAVVGFGLTPTFDHLAEGPRLGVEIWWWLTWFAGLIAVLVPNAISLTVIRVLTPTSVIACLAGAALAEVWEPRVLTAIGWSVLVTAVAFQPTVGDQMINGSAYGSERRMALRPPAVALIGPAQLALLLCSTGLIAPPLLVANGWPAPAALAVVIGGAVCWFAGRVLHQLAKRWVVFVPAGFVVHDPTQLVDAVLLRRTTITALGPAPADPANTALDLSAGSMGLALQAALESSTPVTLRVGGKQAAAKEVEAIVFSPTLPGALLQEARVRGIKIGSDASGG